MENSDNFQRKKCIRFKQRKLKPYEKKILKPGEFRYNITKPAKIPSGHPKVCYERTSPATGSCTESSSGHIHCQAATSTSKSTTPFSPPIEERQVSTIIEGHEDEAPFLSETELYFQELKLKKAISIYGENGKLLVIKDFCFNKKTLHADKFILIERKYVNFQDCSRAWIHWCSCDENNARQIASLEYNLNISFTDFSEHYPDCIHIQAARMIYNQYDLINEIEPVEGDTEGDHGYTMVGDMVYEVPESKIVCCGGMGISRYGLVDLGKKRFSCLTCSSYGCVHVSVLKRIIINGNESPYYELIQSISNDQSNVADRNKIYKPKLISFKKIPFQRSQNLSDGLKDIEEKVDFLLPDLECCRNCGSALKDGDPVLEEWIAYDCAAVITNTSVRYVKVYYRPCSSCDSISIFEGQSKCLLNLGSYLVGYDVLRSYMHSFLHGRRPLYTFYQTWCDVQLDYGNSTIQDVFSYQKLRHAWNSFLQLLDIDFSTGFSCLKCEGDDGYPETIVCDGTSLSFQRRMWEWKDQDSSDVLKLSSSRFSDRVFIPDAVIRNLMKRYASAGEVIRHVRMKPLDDFEKKRLFAEIKNISEPLYKLLTNIQLDTSLFPVYQKLLLCLSSPSPVCVLLKPNADVQTLLESIWKDVKLKEDPVLWTLLHRKIPLLFEIFEHITPTDELKCLLKELWDIAITPFIHAAEDKSEQCLRGDDGLSFFPSLTKLRNRGNFPMDKDQTKQKKKGDNCCKKYRGHPSLLPGIFTVFCPHGICYGFQVMESNESPNVPFTILRTRFKRAPKVVIYDNACKLQEYCLNRDPLFFQETEFYVDRLHWDNHTSCSLAYNLSIYPQHDSINSQCNEQANSSLKRIKDQLSYMTADNFMTHCTFHLWNQNQKITQKMDLDVEMSGE